MDLIKIDFPFDLLESRLAVPLPMVNKPNMGINDFQPTNVQSSRVRRGP